MGATGLDRIKEAVLEFLSRQDEDLPDVCLHRSGCSVVFRKTLLASVKHCIRCMEFAGSGGIRSCAPMFLSDRLGSEGALRSSVGC